jgi:hypothetical protein
MSAPTPRQPAITRAEPAWQLPAAIGILIVLSFALLAMGREPICTCGTVKLWHGEVFSSENSQHIADWYTPSHVIHGVLFFWLLHLFAPGRPIGQRLLVALLIESTWELAENTPAMIDRYRTATIALDYYGDSVINSLSDTLAMVAGFILASRLPVAVTLVAAILIEAATAYLIRDNLTLNVLMLISPIEAIRTWQAGATPAGI